MSKILITPRSLTKDGHPALKRLSDAGYEIIFSSPGSQPGEDELMRLLPGCIGMLAGVEPITAKVLESANELKVISRNGVGISNIDKAAAERLGIRILITPGANSRGVAELAIGMILSLARQIAYSDKKLKNEKWDRKKGFELHGRLLGVVGCGQIGKCVAELALGLGMKVLAYDLLPDNSFKPSPDFKYGSLREVLQFADIISLHCPPQSGNVLLINDGAVDIMKNGVLIVNTARAELVDDQAVLKGLDCGKIAGVGVDVFVSEPPSEWQLAKHEKVLATAHVGGFTDESVDRAVSMAVDNLLAALKEK